MRVSLQVMNPPEAQKAPVVMQMRAELSIRHESLLALLVQKYKCRCSSVYLLYWRAESSIRYEVYLLY